MYNQIDEVVYGVWNNGTRSQWEGPGWVVDADGKLIASNYIGWAKANARRSEHWEAKIIGADGEPVDIEQGAEWEGIGWDPSRVVPVSPREGIDVQSD